MNYFMKEITALSVLFILFSNVSLAQEEEPADSIQFAQIAFERTDYNFGELNQGEKAIHIFNFKNIGDAPLVLNNVLSTCGCTVPEWPKEPILKDSTGVVQVLFDSSSKIGRQNKVITIRSNSKDGDFRLRISAMVLPPKKK